MSGDISLATLYISISSACIYYGVQRQNYLYLKVLQNSKFCHYRSFWAIFKTRIRRMWTRIRRMRRTWWTRQIRRTWRIWRIRRIQRIWRIRRTWRILRIRRIQRIWRIRRIQQIRRIAQAIFKRFLSFIYSATKGFTSSSKLFSEFLGYT